MPARSSACSTVSFSAQSMTVSPCVILTVGVSLTAGLSVERVVAGAFGDSHHLVDGVAVDFHIFQGRLQMADDGVEMALCQPYFSQWFSFSHARHSPNSSFCRRRRSLLRWAPLSVTRKKSRCPRTKR